MEYYIINEKTNQLSVSVSDNMATVSYFSIFDTDTFESQTASLSFELSSFKEAISNLKNSGNMCINDDENGSLEIKAKESLFDMTIKNGSNSSMICDMKIDVESLYNFIFS